MAGRARWLRGREIELGNGGEGEMWGRLGRREQRRGLMG